MCESYSFGSGVGLILSSINVKTFWVQVPVLKALKPIQTAQNLIIILLVIGEKLEIAVKEDFYLFEHNQILQ